MSSATLSARSAARATTRKAWPHSWRSARRSFQEARANACRLERAPPARMRAGGPRSSLQRQERTMKPITLQNYAEGRWVAGGGELVELRSAVNGDVVALTSSQGL